MTAQRQVRSEGRGVWRTGRSGGSGVRSRGRPSFFSSSTKWPSKRFLDRVLNGTPRYRQFASSSGVDSVDFLILKKPHTCLGVTGGQKSTAPGYFLPRGENLATTRRALPGLQARHAARGRGPPGTARPLRALPRQHHVPTSSFHTQRKSSPSPRPPQEQAFHPRVIPPHPSTLIPALPESGGAGGGGGGMTVTFDLTHPTERMTGPKGKNKYN